MQNSLATKVLVWCGTALLLLWSLLPLAAYLTGSTEMFWKMGVAVGDFAKGFVFSPKVWAGIALAGLAVVLFVVDTRSGLTPLDQEVARRLRYVDAPVI